MLIFSNTKKVKDLVYKIVRNYEVYKDQKSFQKEHTAHRLQVKICKIFTTMILF